MFPKPELSPIIFEEAIPNDPFDKNEENIVHN
jgi:hypothetical protein